MRIDRAAPAARAAALLLLAAAGAPLAPPLAPRLSAQDPLSGVGPTTEVSSITFRFEDGPSLEEKELRQKIALTARGGMVGLRRLFGFLPFISPVGQHPFDPLELQRDVVRLRNQYRRAGFLQARVGYEVRYDAEDDLVEVTYVVREGPPLLVDSLAFVAADGGPLAIPEGIAKDWAGFVRRERRNAERFGEEEQRTLADRTLRWFRNRGYPFAAATASAEVDTAASRADVTVRVRHGIRARVREIVVTGNTTVTDEAITRQLPVEPGEWYDGGALEQGRQQLVQFDIVRLALLDVPRSGADDSSVAVRLRVTENPPRFIRGEVGVASGGGIAAQGEWTRRSFLGGLRTLTVAAAAQTGVLGFEDPPERLYRLGVTVFQPYVGDRRISAAGGPFVEYRDDIRDRSYAAGLEASLVYAAAPLRSVSLGYSISHRRVLDYGFSEDLDPTEYLPLLGLADSATVGELDETRNRSVITLDGSYGILDQYANPRKGYVLRPRIQVTTPGGFNLSEYLLLELGGTAFLPVRDRIGLTVRAAVGRVYPFGRTVRDAESESPFVSLLRLRDVAFTAGGTRDVRGWGSQLLGPKLPEVKEETVDGEIRTVAERYTPVGGLARLLGGVELQLPFPGFGKAWRTFLFLDGGRVWTPDSRFALNAGELDQDDFFLGTGAGVGYETVVGAVQVALGYKLNPSALDLRDPDAVLAALRDGRPTESVPTESRRRLQLHFSIGTTF